MQRHAFHRSATLATAGALVLALAASPAAALPLDLAPRAWESLWHAVLHVFAITGSTPAQQAAPRPDPYTKHDPVLNPYGSPQSGQGVAKEVTDHNGPDIDPLG